VYFLNKDSKILLATTGGMIPGNIREYPSVLVLYGVTVGIMPRRADRT